MADIFFDVDGCLIDYQYQTNLDPSEIRKLAASMAEQGFYLHLNSNRSVESLLKIYSQFGFNGKIIAENGILIYDPESGMTMSTGFDKIDLPRLEQALTINPNSKVVPVNTIELVENPLEFKGYFGSASLVVFLEQTRLYTMTVYPRVLKHAEVDFDESLLEEIAGQLTRAFPDYAISPDPKYGNVLMVPQKAEKGIMMPEVAKNSQIASFGDSDADISMFRVSNFSGAPDNAAESVKQAVKSSNGYVTPGKFTQGAYDFMQKTAEVFENE